MYFGDSFTVPMYYVSFRFALKTIYFFIYVKYLWHWCEFPLHCHFKLLIVFIVFYNGFFYTFTISWKSKKFYVCNSQFQNVIEKGKVKLRKLFKK